MSYIWLQTIDEAAPKTKFFSPSARAPLCGEPRQRRDRGPRSGKFDDVGCRHVFEIVEPAIRPTSQRS